MEESGSGAGYGYDVATRLSYFCILYSRALPLNT